MVQNISFRYSGEFISTPLENRGLIWAEHLRIILHNDINNEIAYKILFIIYIIRHMHMNLVTSLYRTSKILYQSISCETAY